jgi:rRNA maturation RNase YbeY
MMEAEFPEFHGEEAAIQFFSEDISFEYPHPAIAQSWIDRIVALENCRLSAELNFVFCSDDYLHRMNVEYLNHDTLTDIITFPYSEPPSISGDIFISIDRVRENAQQYEAPFIVELHRVMIHGVLHLCGYPDKTPEEQKAMRAKENEALQYLSTLSQQS